MEINGQQVMEVNNKDLLYFENKNLYKENKSYSIYDKSDALFPFIEIIPEGQKNVIFNSMIHKEGPHFDFKESLALSFKLNSQYLYGLPERAEKTLLDLTDEGYPYRFYNVDIFQHNPYNKQNLYGSIPYMTAHTNEFDTAIAWINSAESYVDIMRSSDPS